jgi:iron(III) transport system ATP-binding protein
MSKPEALRLEAIAVRFGRTVAVDGATLDVREGELVTLLGPSGCGKTTLLRCVAGFERVDAGQVWLGGELVESRDRHVPAHRRSVGLVFQDFALFPHRTAAENIAYGLGRRPDRQRVQQLLDLAGLDGLGGRYPHQLSTGQQQRVAILRSLAPRPRLLLLDEPFSNLDASLHATMREQVAAILRAEGVTTLMVTHDRGDAFALADRVALMSAGRILQQAPPEELYYRPVSLEAAAFAGEVQAVPGVTSGGIVETELGALAAAGPVVDGPCQALIRPEWLVPCASGMTAVLSDCRLEGQLTRGRLTLPGGRQLTMALATGRELGEGPLRVAVTVPVPTFAVEPPA